MQKGKRRKLISAQQSRALEENKADRVFGVNSD